MCEEMAVCVCGYRCVCVCVCEEIAVCVRDCGDRCMCVWRSLCVRDRCDVTYVTCGGGSWRRRGRSRRSGGRRSAHG